VTTISFPLNSTNGLQTSVSLDGSTYTLATVWNFYRVGWYYSLTDQNGTLVQFSPLVGSPPNATIYLAPGLFQTSTLAYRVGSQQFEIGP
jgi:hypothetical protein